MDDPDASLISEREVLEGSVASAAAGGSGARSYGSTAAKLVQPVESKTPGSARNAQESDERWPALTNAQNLSYTLKVKEVKVSSGLMHLGAEYLGQPLVAGGGFGADFTQNSLLAQYRPDLLHLEHLEHCTGDAIKVGEAKFLAALRGLAALRNRFGGKADLRDRREVENPFRLDASEEIGDNASTIRDAERRSSTNLVRTWECLCRRGRTRSRLTIRPLRKQILMEDRTPRPRVVNHVRKPPARLVQERRSTIKSFLEHISQHSLTFVTPVIHYCMGGSKIDEQFWVPIPSQSAEVAGGVRDNRLGGNSLLDYVVSGRVEGVACAKYDWGKALAGGRKVEGSKSDQAIVVNTVLKNGGIVVLRQQAESTERERSVRKIQQGGAKKPELAKLRKLSSFQCAKRCKSRTLRSAAKRELRGVTHSVAGQCRQG